MLPTCIVRMSKRLTCIDLKRLSSHLVNKNAELELLEFSVLKVCVAGAVVPTVEFIGRLGNRSNLSLVCCTCCLSNCNCCCRNCNWDWTDCWDCCALRRTPESCDRSSAIGSIVSRTDAGFETSCGVVEELPKLWFVARRARACPRLLPPWRIRRTRLPVGSSCSKVKDKSFERQGKSFKLNFFLKRHNSKSSLTMVLVHCNVCSVKRCYTVTLRALITSSVIMTSN